MKVPIKYENDKLIDADGMDILNNESERTVLFNCINNYPVLSNRVSQLFERLSSVTNMLIGSKFMNDDIRASYKLIASYIKEDTQDLHLFHFRFEMDTTNDKGEAVKAPGSFFLPAKNVEDLANSILTTVNGKLKDKIVGTLNSSNITDARDEDFNNVTEELIHYLKEIEKDQTPSEKIEKTEDNK